MDITIETYSYAENAIKDILYLFYDMATSYDGFGHNLNRGLFSPLAFINSKDLPPPNYSFGINVELLQSGSAIALLSILSDIIEDHETLEVYSPNIIATKCAFDAGLFVKFPQINIAFEYAFSSRYSDFFEQLDIVYETYVLSQFKVLSQCRRA